MPTDAEMAGLDEKHVVAFTDMGFERAKVVRAVSLSLSLFLAISCCLLLFCACGLLTPDLGVETAQLWVALLFLLPLIASYPSLSLVSLWPI